MHELRLTRIRDLLALGLAFVTLGWLVGVTSYSALPSIRLLAGLPLLVLAVLEVGLGVHLRRRIAHGEIGVGLHQTNPITVARSAALAKASALVGVITAGLWGGLLIYLTTQIPRVQAATDDLPGVVLGIVAGVVLAAAAIWLERGCVTPPQAPFDGAA